MAVDILKNQAQIVSDLVQGSAGNALIVSLDSSGGKDPVAWAGQCGIVLPDGGVREICHIDAYKVLYRTLVATTEARGDLTVAAERADCVAWTIGLMLPYEEKVSGRYFTAFTPKLARFAWKARAQAAPPLGLLVLARRQRLCIWPATPASSTSALGQ